MNELEFWIHIHEAKEESDGDTDSFVKTLINNLCKLSEESILNFLPIYWGLMEKSYTDNILAAYLIVDAKGGADDSFEDFRGWLITQGQAIFYSVLKNPEILIDLPNLNQNKVELDLFAIIQAAYEQKTGEEDFPPSIGYWPEYKPIEKDWNIYLASITYPRLYAKFRLDTNH